MRTFKSRFAAFVIAPLLAMPLSAKAQDRSKAAILIADQVLLSRDGTLTASGNVEAFQNGLRLTAKEISYDRQSGALNILGPITLYEGENTVILADQANLDQSLKNGLLRGARMVMNQQLQLASAEMHRVNGRYTQLYKTAVTSCHVCDDGRPPLWQIRAKRIIHDQEEKQLYFHDTQFKIRNTTVFYLPRLRLPDPSLKRATGFLIPEFKSTSSLGTGIKIPYFIKIGDHKDLTLTPYFSSKTKTLEFRYRQAFRTGQIQFQGALTRDDLASGNRGYLFGHGRFDLVRDYVLDFDVKAASDPAYLAQYGYSDKDRLDSQIAISRARRDKYVRFSFTNYHSLRDTEDNATIPSNILEMAYETRFFPERLGGEITLSSNLHAHYRRSSVDIDSADSDSIVDGRDVARFSYTANWQKNWQFGNGLQAQSNLGFTADVFRIRQDQSAEGTYGILRPYGAFSLRYPLIKRSGTSTQILEPLIQLGWVGGPDGDHIPNDESTRVEFDEGNLLALSQFPKGDRREHGLRAAVGVNWSFHSAKSWNASLSFGQIYTQYANTAFTESSGRQGRRSDLLFSGQLRTQSGWNIIGRGIFNRDFSLSKSEIRANFSNKRMRIGSSYLWLQKDLEENRANEVSELTFDGSYQINENWRARTGLHYDILSDSPTKTSIGFTYENECVTVDFSVTHRNTTSTTLEPSTDLGFKVSLGGFSASDGTKRYQRSCRKHIR